MKMKRMENRRNKGFWIIPVCREPLKTLTQMSGLPRFTAILIMNSSANDGKSSD